nr:putative ribonuclease H-like domain-containing protein [Tanacetum cinerariifolium]
MWVLQKIREKNVPDEPISVHLYRSMIGCLMYLTATRPDIMFAVCAAARHQVTPKTSNLLSVMQIFKYLTAYPKLGRDSTFDLEAFSDSDYAGAHGDRKSTTGGCQFLRRRLISWQCKKQTIVATSFCEAEYVAAASCCGQWLLVTSVGRVIFCWLIVIHAGDLVPAASEVSLPDGVKGLDATIDGTSYTVTKASIRSALQLDTTPYPAPLVTMKIFANMRHYQGPDMPLLAHMLNQREPALVKAQPQEVSLPPPSHVVEPHPSTDPMPSPPRQSSPSPIRFGPAPSSAVASTDPIPEIPSSSRPTAPVLETITSPIRDDDTGGGSFPERPPSPSPVTLTRSPTVGVAEEPLTLNSLLSLFPTCLQRIATLEAELKATKIFTRRSLHDPSASTTPSKPDNQEQDPAKGKAIATPSSPVTTPYDKELADQRARVAEEQEREIRASVPQSTPRQAKLDRIALKLINEEWIGLVDQWKAIAEMKAKAKRDKPLTPAQEKEYMRAFVKNQSTAIYTTGWTWKVVRGLTDDQLQNRSGETLDSSKSKKLKSSHRTEQSAELLETTFVSAGATLATGDPISDVPSVSAVLSVSAASSIPAETPIATGVSTTTGVFESTSVPIIDLLDSPPKATSLPLHSATAEQAVPLRKSSRKKSMARRRTLPRPSQSESATLPFEEDDPKAEFKKYLRPVSDVDEPAEHVSLSLVSDIRMWEIIPTEFGLGEIHVITRADGTVKRFSTLRELMYWAGRADLMVLYGMVSDKYKLERATGIGLGLWSDLRTLITAREDQDASIIWDDQDQWKIQSWRFYALPAIHALETEAGDIMYMFVDKKYPILPATIQRMLNHGLEIDRDPSGNDLTTAIQLIQSLLHQLHPAT